MLGANLGRIYMKRQFLCCSLGPFIRQNLLNSSDRLDTVLSIGGTVAKKKIETPTHLASQLTCWEEQGTGIALVTF